jgi:hypothetical protein
MITGQLRGTLLAALGFAASLMTPATVVGQSTYLVDTGAGSTSSLGSASLFASGSTTCSPQPQCAAAFQFLAAQFTLPEAASISSIEAWMTGNTAGSVAVKIRADLNGLPAPIQPPLYSPSNVYAQTYSIPGRFGAGWVAFSNYSAVLAAGTYWVTIEPVAGSGFNSSMPGGAPAPLAKYAYFADGNSGYRTLTDFQNFPNSSKLGIRIAGSKFSGLAFGTATRVSAAGNHFSSCCPFNVDRISQAISDFSPVQSDALTVSYIFEIPGAYVHGRGKIIENGLTAGAYSTMDLASGAGRGVAFRTFMNMSNVAKTFRVNAALDGAYFNSGGLGRAGIYVFDTTQFSNTLVAGGPSAANFLLSADDVSRIANVNANISLARFFPAGTLLASDLEVANFTIGQPSTLPMATGFLTVQPGGTITVMFDVAAYASSGGSANFANTLKPAANLFTDTSNNPVVEMVAIGRSAPTTPAVAALTLAPVTAATPLGELATATATATTTGGTPVADTQLTFTIGSGPNAGLTVTASTDQNGEATLTYTSGTLGTDAIQAAAGTVQSNIVQNTWQTGPLDHLAITPLSATIAAGGSQAYTVEGFDAFNNSRGNVTSSATFSIAPDGSCTGATCTASVPGSHTVSATFGGKTAQAALTVTGTTGYTFQGFFAPVDNAPVLNITKAGGAVPVKFSLNGDQGLNILSAGYPASQPIVCDSASAADAIEETVAAGGSSFSYDATTDQYVYVWKTDKAWVNTCRQLNVKLSDGSNHLANFKFTK